MKRMTSKKLSLVVLAWFIGLGLIFIQSLSLTGAQAMTGTSGIRNLKSQIGDARFALRDEFTVPTAYTGAAGLQQVLEAGLAQPLSLASADFNEDGVPDLVSGYVGPSGGLITLHRGNVESIF